MTVGYSRAHMRLVMVSTVSSTEPGVVHEQGSHPGVGVGGGLLAPHDPVLVAGDAALPRHALAPLLVPGEPLRDGRSHTEDVVENISRNVLARVPWCEGGVLGLDSRPVDWEGSFLICCR